MGVNGLTKYFAGALGPWGINVNAIAPGVTMTEATKTRRAAEEMLSMLVMFTALKKALQPEDLTGTAVFLASDGQRPDDRSGAGGRRRHDHARVVAPALEAPPPLCYLPVCGSNSNAVGNVLYFSLSLLPQPQPGRRGCRQLAAANEHHDDLDRVALAVKADHVLVDEVVQHDAAATPAPTSSARI